MRCYPRAVRRSPFAVRRSPLRCLSPFPFPVPRSPFPGPTACSQIAGVRAPMVCGGSGFAGRCPARAALASFSARSSSFGHALRLAALPMAPQGALPAEPCNRNRERSPSAAACRSPARCSADLLLVRCHEGKGIANRFSPRRAAHPVDIIFGHFRHIENSPRDPALRCRSRAGRYQWRPGPIFPALEPGQRLGPLRLRPVP